MPGHTGPVIVGAVALEVVPDTTNFLKNLAKDIAPDVDKVADSIGSSIDKKTRPKVKNAVKGGLNDAAGDAAEAGGKAAAAFAGAFARKAVGLNKVIQDALPDFDIVVAPDVKLSGLHQLMDLVDQTKARLAEITDPEVTPTLDAKAFRAELALLKREMAGVLKRTQPVDVELRSNIRTVLGDIDRYTEGISKAATATGSFAREGDAALGKLLTSISDLKVDVPVKITVEGQQQFEGARLRLEALEKQIGEFRQLHLGIDIDDTTYIAKLREFEDRAKQISDTIISKRVGVEIADGVKDLEKFNAKIEGFGKTEVTKKITLELEAGPASKQVGVLATKIQSVIGSAIKGLPHPDLGFDLGPAQDDLAKIFAELKLLGDYTVGVNLDPAEAIAQLLVLRSALKNTLDRSDITASVRAGAQASFAEIDKLSDHVGKLKFPAIEPEIAPAKVERQLGVLDETIHQTIASAFKALPTPDLHGLTALDDELRLIFGEVEDLNRTKLDLDNTALLQRLADVHDGARMALADPDIDTAWTAALRKAVKGLDELAVAERAAGGQLMTPEVDTKPAVRSLGTLQTKIKELADGIVKDNLDLKIKADPTPAERAILEVATLAEHISAIITMGVADDEAIEQLLALDVLGDHVARTRKIDFKMDTGASVRLREVEQAVAGVVQGIEAVGGAASGVLGPLAQMGKSLSEMGPAAIAANVSVVAFLVAIPILVAVASAAIIGLIGLLGFAAIVVGSLFLGVGVLVFAFKDIITAIGEKEQAAKQAAANAAQDDATELSNKQALASADRSIATAAKTLARARVNAVTSVAQANRTLAGAQRNLVIANQKENDTRRKLGLTYKSGRTDLALLTAEIRANRIEQQAAIVSITQAREAYNRILADPTASESAIEAAQSEYNMKELALKKLKADQLKELKTNEEAVRDAKDAVATAKENATKAATDAANSIDDAETGLADARTARATTLAQQQAAAAATAAQRAAQTKTYDDLDPAAKAFVDFYQTTLKPIIHDLMGAAQKAILPGVTAFFTSLSTPETMAALKTAITQIGTAFGDLLTKIGAWLASKDGQDFIKWLGDNGADGIKIFGDLLKELKPLIAPLTVAITEFMKQMTPAVIESMSDAIGELVDWLSSDDFKDFLDQMIANGPLLLITLVDMTFAVLTLMDAFAPLGNAILICVDSVSMLIDWLGSGGLLWIFATVAVAAAGLAAIFAAPFVAVAALVVIAVFAVGALVVWLWNRFNWFGGAVGRFFSRLGHWLGKVVSGFLGWLVGVVKDRFHDVLDFLHYAFVGQWVDTWNDLKPVVTGFWKWIVGRFTAGVKAIGEAWSHAKEILSMPIYGMIGMINKYIVSPINTVAHWAGAEGIDPIDVPKAVHMAHGGVLPGYAPGRDIIPVLASPGEGWLVPQAVRQLGRGTIEWWNALALRGQTIQGFASGGIVENETPHIGGAPGVLLNPIVGALSEPLRSFAERYGDNGLIHTLTSIPMKMLLAITSFFTSAMEKLAEVGAAVADAGSSVLKYLGLDQDTGDANADQTATGIMATPPGAAHYAKTQLPKYGWDAGQMDSLAALWDGESGWRWNAKNPLSGAYGIPQALPGTKMGSAGSDWAINAFHQIDWGLGYIRDRYTDPAGALAFWQAQQPHWYDQGGYLPTGITLANNNTGKPEHILTAAQWDAMAGQATGGGGMDINVRVHDGSVTGLVTAEVDRQFGSLADAHIYGGA